MNQLATFTLALASRLLGTLATVLSTWLLEKVLEGADLGLDLLADAWEFARYVYQTVAYQVCGPAGRPAY
ncbi:MAG: hypothetical protein JNM56_11965 [Planctomycetia bacterium]|nr:hypothetical protein [Planctomycetia bacterium]